MKKIVALMLCLVLAVSMVAFAEEETTENVGLNIAISEITLNFGEPVTLNQTISYSFGVQDDVLWFELGILQNDTSVVTAQVEVDGDARYLSVDGAEDALMFNYKLMDLFEEETGEEVTMTVDDIKAGVEQMNDPASIAAEIEGMADEFEGVTVEVLGDLDYRISYASPESGMGGSFRMVLSVDGEKDFDLKAKNVVEITEDMTEDTYPENDVMTVAVEKLAELGADEQIAAVIEAAGALADTEEAEETETAEAEETETAEAETEEVETEAAAE